MEKQSKSTDIAEKVRNIVLGLAFTAGIIGIVSSSKAHEYILPKGESKMVESFPARYNGMLNDSTFSLTTRGGIDSQYAVKDGVYFNKTIKYDVTKATPDTLVLKYHQTN